MQAGFELKESIQLQVHVDNQTVVKLYNIDAVTLKMKNMESKHHYAKDSVRQDKGSGAREVNELALKTRCYAGTQSACGFGHAKATHRGEVDYRTVVF